jgi:hypothetical protein
MASGADAITRVTCGSMNSVVIVVLLRGPAEAAGTTHMIRLAWCLFPGGRDYGFMFIQFRRNLLWFHVCGEQWIGGRRFTSTACAEKRSIL